MSNSNRDNNQENTHHFGVVIPRTIGIGAIFLFLIQGGFVVWNISKYTTSVDRMAERIEQTAADINKVKSDIYTRSEANIQFDAIRREIEQLNRTNDRQDSDIKELRGRR